MWKDTQKKGETGFSANATTIMKYNNVTKTLQQQGSSRECVAVSLKLA